MVLPYTCEKRENTEKKCPGAHPGKIYSQFSNKKFISNKIPSAASSFLQLGGVAKRLGGNNTRRGTRVKNTYASGKKLITVS